MLKEEQQQQVFNLVSSFSSLNNHTMNVSLLILSSREILNKELQRVDPSFSPLIILQYHQKTIQRRIQSNAQQFHSKREEEKSKTINNRKEDA